jgi:hypothetical protein
LSAGNYFIGEDKNGLEHNVNEIHYRLATSKEIEMDNLKNIFIKSE